MLHDVDIDMVDLVQCERVNAPPIGPLIHQNRIPTIGRLFRQDDELRVGSDDRFVCDLGIATVGGIVNGRYSCHARPAKVHRQRNHRQRHMVFLAYYRLLRATLWEQSSLPRLP